MSDQALGNPLMDLGAGTTPDRLHQSFGFGQAVSDAELRAVAPDAVGALPCERGPNVILNDERQVDTVMTGSGILQPSCRFGRVLDMNLSVEIIAPDADLRNIASRDDRASPDENGGLSLLNGPRFR